MSDRAIGRTTVPRRMRQAAASLVAVLAAALVVSLPSAAAHSPMGPAGRGAAPASSAWTTFGAIAIDPTLGDEFVSVPGANAIDLFGASGKLLGTIPRIYGAWGMVVAGQYLYVAESTTGEIVRLTVSRTAFSQKVIVSGLNQPTELVAAGGKLWTALSGDDGEWLDSVASIDPTTGAVTPIPVAIDYPDLAAAPGDPSTLYVDEDGQSPGEIYAFNATTTPATEKLDVLENSMSNIQNMAVSADGTRVIPAAGSPYEFQELSGSTLQPDGLVYPAQPYPDADATSPSNLLATGLEFGSPDISVFKLGVPAAIFTANTDPTGQLEYVLPHGLALTASGSELYAVAESPSGGLMFDTFAVSDSARASRVRLAASRRVIARRG